MDSMKEKLQVYTINVYETDLGLEKITTRIPYAPQRVRRHLDKNGIVRIGSVVTTDDILVGKVTPKAQTDISEAERFIMAIFNGEASHYRNSSLRMPQGKSGVVVKVVRCTSLDGTKTQGVIEQIHVYVAE